MRLTTILTVVVCILLAGWMVYVLVATDRMLNY